MTFSDHLLIRASAGSGKTHQLTSRFIGLLVAGEEPCGILAVTFTRLAAGEILERILGRMLKATRNRSELQKLQDSLVEADFPSPSLEQVEDALRRLIDDLHRCNISTLDAFFSRLALAHTFECGLPPGWTILEQDQLNAVRAGAIQKILAQGDPADARLLMHRLSRGSASSQVSDQLQQIVSSAHEKFLEFPVDAWNNPEISSPPDQKEIDLVREQFESVECPLTKAGTPKKHWEKSLEKIRMWFDDREGVDPLTLFSSGLPKALSAGESSYSGEDIPDEIRVTIQLLGNIIRSDLSRTIRSQNLATRELLASYDQFRTEGLHAHGGVGYQDVPLALTIAGVLAAPGTILYRLDANTRHLLLDEFQDTSMVQFAALQPLIEEVASDADGGRTVFCVGDPKQAIYGWRGGRAEVLDLIEAYLKPGSNRTLDASYRSSQEILDGVNQVFGNLPPAGWLEQDQVAITSWCDNFHDQFTAAGGPGDAPGHVVLKVAREHPDRNPEVCPYIDAIDEVERVIQKSPEASIAILVRKNRNIARMVAALRERGIDASEEGGNPLVDSPAVGRLVALLELVEHPGDATMRFAIARSPFPDLAGVIEGFPTGDWEDPEVAKAISSLMRSRIHQLGIIEAISPLARELARISSPEDRIRIHQMLEQLHIRRPGGCRLEDLITHLRTHRLSSPSGSRVQVMTVHQAKGLGRDVVILPELAVNWFEVLPGLLEQRDPSPPRGDQPRAQLISRYIKKMEQQILGEPYIEMNRQARQSRLQEALSILYVAMTRAKRSLTMIIPAKKPPEASAAAVLWKTLGQDQPLEAGTILFEKGDADSITTITGDPVKASQQARIPDLQASKAGSTRSPSKHTAFFSTAKSSRARSIGTLAHFALELLDWNAELPPEMDQILAREYPRLVQFIDEAVPLLRHALGEQGLKEILDREATGQRLGQQDGDQIVLEREVPFCCKLGEDVLNGIIDRLVILERNGQPIAAEVIDFKTDQISGSAQETADKHRDQLESYRSAVSRTWGIDPDRISTRIALIQNGAVVNL
ncbi:MAG: UvrD-helicase domain-containing protein [Planctomycetota bacterium]